MQIKGEATGFYLECGCRVYDHGSVKWCPLHAAAREMREFIRSYAKHACLADDPDDPQEGCYVEEKTGRKCIACDAHALLAKVGG